jgi:hypothetical protein
MWEQNVLTVNGTTVFGGISPGPQDPILVAEDNRRIPLWKTHLLIVSGLREENVLHIESPIVAGSRDDFIIDNVVVFFKTRAPGHVTPPQQVATE